MLRCLCLHACQCLHLPVPPTEQGRATVKLKPTGSTLFYGCKLGEAKARFSGGVRLASALSQVAT